MGYSVSRVRALSLALASLAVLVAVGLGLRAALAPASAHGQNLNQLQGELGATHAQEQTLQANIEQIGREIATLTSQISLVQSREQTVRATLAAERTKLAAARAAVRREEARVSLLKARLGRARLILARQLVSGYENAKPDLVSVVLSANGFGQLLNELTFLSDAENQQQKIIRITRAAKREAQAATVSLTRLQDADARTTKETATEASALAGMNALLQSREAAIGHARAAQETALGAARVRGAQLQDAITRVQAQEAAAARAAALATQQQASQGSATSSVGAALASSGGWVIPSPIVLCESGGQNLPPNSAGASGYYQIIPGTWRLFGGTGPAAYLASKAEQDAVASRIWAGGAGASDWVCAGLVGIR
jgi:septal ring factor EnvC (AmiA/AmiB activator)